MYQEAVAGFVEDHPTYIKDRYTDDDGVTAGGVSKESRIKLACGDWVASAHDAIGRANPSRARLFRWKVGFNTCWTTTSRAGGGTTTTSRAGGGAAGATGLAGASGTAVGAA